jgi:hypothetical protein
MTNFPTTAWIVMPSSITPEPGSPSHLYYPTGRQSSPQGGARTVPALSRATTGSEGGPPGNDLGV